MAGGDARPRSKCALAGGARQKHGKFLTPKPGDHVAIPQHCPAGCNHIDQHAVACQMPITVVDLLEVVDIKADQADRRGLIAFDEPVGGGLECRPRSRACQPIMIGLPPEFHFLHDETGKRLQDSLLSIIEAPGSRSMTHNDPRRAFSGVTSGAPA